MEALQGMRQGARSEKRAEAGCDIPAQVPAIKAPGRLLQRNVASELELHPRLNTQEHITSSECGVK